MKSTCFVFSALVATALVAAPASAAVVAVMPVQGVNLSPGQCDAIGVLFTQAFARETNVAVASPLETAPLLAQGRTAAMVTSQLGATEFVDLRAVQMENRVTLAGIRYGKAGNEVFRSEIAAPSVDDMQLATARLARALAWRQPIAPMPYPVAPTAYPVAPVPMAEPALAAPTVVDGPRTYPKALGIKTGLIFPWAQSRTYAPMMSFQFDARFGTRDAFIEIGAGGAIPTSSSSARPDDIRMGGVFAELGGSMYLTDGNIAPYLGGGISPRIWFVDSRDYSTSDGTTCAVYGQAGVTLTRDSRARLYAELRVSQYLIGLAEGASSSYGERYAVGDTLYPTEFALQIGLGW
jgi:hypothetical protein